MIKTFLIIIVFLILYYVFIEFRLMIAHPFKTVKNAIVDFYDWLYCHGWNKCNRADLICYTGLFGQGKTLSAVHHIVSMYNRYNDKKIYDNHRKEWVIQKVKVISNVHFNNIPYEYMRSLSQIVHFTETQKEIDKENKELTILFVLIDESSVQLNSRNFKSNIDMNFLNALLTSRHHNIKQIITTSQRFHLQDKILRDVTQKVIDCKKAWRFQKNTVYDAWDLENATNVTLIKPLSRSGFFVTNKDYNSYDTYACVEELAKSCKDGDMLSEEEILALRCNMPSDLESVTNTSKTYKKLTKQENKRRNRKR